MTYPSARNAIVSEEAMAPVSGTFGLVCYATYSVCARVYVSPLRLSATLVLFVDDPNVSCAPFLYYARPFAAKGMRNGPGLAE